MQLHPQRGFTLLESMVALTILLTALGGPFVVTQLGLRTARQAGQELVAANLAQEAIEYIRYRRDTNAFSGQFISGFEGCVADISDDGPATCTVDAISDTVYEVDSGFGCDQNDNMLSCPFIKYNDSSALYGYDSGEDTIFRRAVHMQVVREIDGVPKEVRVVAEVSWSDIGTQRDLALEEYITDWR